MDVQSDPKKNVFGEENELTLQKRERNSNDTMVDAVVDCNG